ncbi:MAG: BrnT family toxin [Gemmatimonadota bacterium]|jgi:uncharacterized DUF497 family protein
MSQLRFEWDPAKAGANLRKHGVGFEEARTVFEDAEGLLIPDPDHSDGEERFVLIGLSSALRVLVVIHCEREDGDVLRIISARKADRAERASYAAQRRP